MKNNDKLIRILTWSIISFQTILLAIFFIIQTLRIYFGEYTDQMYTREKVGSYLLEILVLIIIWIVVVIFGIIISFIKNVESKNVIKNTEIYKLNTILKMIPTYKISETDEDYKIILKEERNRKISYAILTSILLICALMSFLYLFNPNHFISSGIPNEQVVNMVLHILPFVIIGFTMGIIRIFYETYSAKKSITAAKNLLKKYKKEPKEIQEISKKEFIIVNSLRGVFLTIAIVFIIIGIVNGDPISVYNKAAKICSECIGLG